MAAVRRIEFLKYANMLIFTYRTVCNLNLYVLAKFHLDRLNGYGVIMN